MHARLTQIPDRFVSAWRYAPGLAVCLASALVAIWLVRFAGTGIVWARLLRIAVASTVAIRAELLLGIEVAGKHALAHAVAAGYSVDADAGNVAALTKLMRVALLAPMLLLFGAAAECGRTGSPLPVLPWFLVVLSALRCSIRRASFRRRSGMTPAGVSRFCLVLAMVGIGIMLP